VNFRHSFTVCWGSVLECNFAHPTFGRWRSSKTMFLLDLKLLEERRMKIFSFVMGAVVLAGLVACKPSADSEANIAARSSSTAAGAEACSLNDVQFQLVSGAAEFKSLENVDLMTLSANEKSEISKKRKSSNCTPAEMSSLTDIFPSIAAKLSPTSGSEGTATAMALGDTLMGVPGVTRTEYIRMPTGSRYIAGYNADGMMILLQRLLQRRP